MKINFTQEHYQKMQALLLGMLLNNETILSKMGAPLNVVDILHTTTINSLNDIRLNLAKQIEKYEQADEWVQTNLNQAKLERLKASKELVNLVIGYKRLQLEIAENRRKKEELETKIAEMKEAQKTPEDRLKEAEAELAALEAENF